jgi:hypothetical protein
MGWFVGQVMKAMQGKANPQAVNEILPQRSGIYRNLSVLITEVAAMDPGSRPG